MLRSRKVPLVFALAAVSVVQFGIGCTVGSVQMIVPPGEARPTPNAATSDTAPTGLLRYRNALGKPSLQKKIRAKAEKAMDMVCWPARYAIDAEGPKTSGVAGPLSTSLPPLSMPEAIAVALDESTAAITDAQYWYIRFSCKGRGSDGA